MTKEKGVVIPEMNKVNGHYLQEKTFSSGYYKGHNTTDYFSGYPPRFFRFQDKGEMFMKSWRGNFTFYTPSRIEYK